MHIQIINFNLSGISRSEYEAAAAEAAQTNFRNARFDFKTMVGQ